MTVLDMNGPVCVNIAENRSLTYQIVPGISARIRHAESFTTKKKCGKARSMKIYLLLFAFAQIHAEKEKKSA